MANKDVYAIWGLHGLELPAHGSYILCTETHQWVVCKFSGYISPKKLQASHWVIV